MPVLNKCCCCISLPTGGIILGALSLVGAILMVVVNSFGLYATYFRFDEDVNADELLQQASQEQDDSSLTLVRVIFGGMIVMYAFLAVVSVFMIVGSKQVRKNQPESISRPRVERNISQVAHL